MLTPDTEVYLTITNKVATLWKQVHMSTGTGNRSPRPPPNSKSMFTHWTQSNTEGGKRPGNEVTHWCCSSIICTSYNCYSQPEGLGLWAARSDGLVPSWNMSGDSLGNATVHKTKLPTHWWAQEGGIAGMDEQRKANLVQVGWCTHGNEKPVSGISDCRQIWYCFYKYTNNLYTFGACALGYGFITAAGWV